MCILKPASQAPGVYINALKENSTIVKMQANQNDKRDA